MTHVNEKGDETKVYDFGSLSLPPKMQQELARVFARRAHSTGTWRNIPSSKQAFWAIGIFARWLNSSPHTPASSRDLSVAMWKEYRLASVGHRTTLRALTLMRYLLLGSTLLSAHTRAEVAKRTPREQASEVSYTDAELKQIRSAARGVFRRAYKRISENSRHLARHRAGEFDAASSDFRLGVALEAIAANGDAPRRWDQRAKTVNEPHRTALGGETADKTWKRLFLTGAEVSAALILLACAEGWNYTSIAELEVPTRIDGTLPTAESTMFRLELEKRRRSSRLRYESVTLTDTGPASTARLVQQIVEVTEPARELLSRRGTPTTRLLISRNRWLRQEPKFTLGVNDEQRRLFAAATGHWVNLRRVRTAVNTRHRREPNQNTRNTHDQAYVLSDPEVSVSSEPMIASGIEAAVTHAQVHMATIAAADEELGVETVTAECIDELSSPFSPWGIPCAVSFLLCLACTNAVVMPKHLGRLAYLHEVLSSLRLSLSPTTWEREWSSHYDRLHSLRTDHYTEAQWIAALAKVTDIERRTVDRLVRGELET